MEPYSSEFLHCMKEIVMKIVSVNMVKAKVIEKKNSMHISFKMFVKLGQFFFIKCFTGNFEKNLSRGGEIKIKIKQEMV